MLGRHVDGGEEVAQAMSAFRSSKFRLILPGDCVMAARLAAAVVMVVGALRDFDGE